MDDVVAAFDEAGIGDVLVEKPHGRWTDVDGLLGVDVP
jgi:hypothetical protein